jgi:hypothetical protein
VDQSTFGFAVFLWFASVGWVTVTLAGGIRYRRRTPRPAQPSRGPSGEPGEPTDVIAESDDHDPDAPAPASATDQPSQDEGAD